MAQTIPSYSESLEDSTNRLINLHKIYITVKDNLISDYFTNHSQTLTDKDTRKIIFYSLMVRVEYYLIAENFQINSPLEKAEPILKMFTQVGISLKDESQKVKIVEGYIKEYLDWLKFSFFLHSFIDLEVGIRTLSSELSITIENIGKNIEALITLLGVDNGKSAEDSYKRLWDILAYTRNTMHNGGIHRKPTNSLKYKGKDFNFIQDKAIDFLTSENVCFLLEESAYMMRDFYSSSNVVSLNKEILNIYHDITFD